MFKRRKQLSVSQADNLSFMGVPIIVRDYVPDNEFWLVPKDAKLEVTTAASTGRKTIAVRKNASANTNLSEESTGQPKENT